MTAGDLSLIDESLQRHGDDFWNKPNNGGWIITKLLDLLAKDNLDLKVIRKK